jgi:hypothetical protein
MIKRARVMIERLRKCYRESMRDKKKVRCWQEIDRKLFKTYLTNSNSVKGPML